MPLGIYPFSCGLLKTQALVFLSKELFIGHFSILFHLLLEQSTARLRRREACINSYIAPQRGPSVTAHNT